MNQPDGSDMNIISLISSIRLLDSAYAWYRVRHLEAHDNHPFWSLSFQWNSVKHEVRQALQQGTYQFQPLDVFDSNNHQRLACWQPLDAIVLKCMTWVLTPLLKNHCDLSLASHLKHQGGLKKAVREAQSALNTYQHVYKTDIADFYGSIPHHLLHEQCCSLIPDKRVNNLLRQMMNRVHVYQGQYRLIDNKGIPRGCSLSPLLGALYLSSIDHYAKQNKIKYIRYMDDFVFFTNSKVHLRRIIKDVYGMVNQLGLRLAQAKTWVGRTTKGMDFLGYRLSRSGLLITQSTWDRMTAKSEQLYEQGASISRLHVYAKKWISWAQSGVRVETLWLKLKTTLILQNICGETLLLE